MSLEQADDRAPETLASVDAAIPARLCDCGCGVPLNGRQKRFATRLCCSRWWDQQHPRVNRGPAGPREGRLIDSVAAYLEAHMGEWFTAQEVAVAVRGLESSVGRRVRELRARGRRIEFDALPGNAHRVHRFRLVERG